MTSASSLCSASHLVLACTWCAAQPPLPSASCLLHKSFVIVSCVSAVQIRTGASLHHRATATGVGMKAVGSWLMLCSLISVVVFSVCTVDGTTEEDMFCIHEWLMMSSKDGRSAGRRHRHHLISCWHSGGGGGQPISQEH